MALVVNILQTKAIDIRDSGSIPRSGKSPGGGHGNPLQYSYLENPMDRGAWLSMVHKVAKRWTKLKWLSIQQTHIHTHTHTQRLYTCLVWSYAAQRHSLMILCFLFIRISCSPLNHSFVHSGWDQRRVSGWLEYNFITPHLSFCHCYFLAANV